MVAFPNSTALKAWTIVLLFVLTTGSQGWLWAAPASTPRRIVSTAPSITEMIYALRADELLVGVTSYCDYPPEAQSKTIIGDFASPNVETVLKLRPDLVVVLSDRDDVLNKLSPFHVPTLVLRQETLDDVFQSLRTLGAAIGRAEQAELLSRSLADQLSRIASSAEAKIHPSVFFVVSRDVGALTGLYSVGKGSYIDQLIEIAGGKNVLGPLSAAYPKVSVEEVLARNPDIIVDMSHGGGTSPEQIQRVKSIWSALDTVSAVRNNRVYVLDSDVFIVPGPRVVEAAARLDQVFHESHER